MPPNLRTRLYSNLLPALGALAVGGLALLLVWWMQRAAQVETYDPARHDRVRVVTVDTAKQKECLDRYPAEQRRTEGYLRCTEGFVYERQQDFFIDKRPANPR